MQTRHEMVERTSKQSDPCYVAGPISTTGALRKSCETPGVRRPGLGMCVLLLSLASLAAAGERSFDSAGSRVGKVLQSIRRDQAKADREQQADAPRIAKTRVGYLRTLAAPDARHFIASAGVRGDPQASARSFLAEHKAAFGTSHRAFDVMSKTVRTRTTGSRVRFAQTFADIPVFGAETVVQLNPDGGVEYVSSDFMTDDQALDFELSWSAPVLTEIDAAEIAVAVLGQENPGLQFQADPATLMIYQPSVVGNAGPARLVWQTRVASTPQPGLAERVLVDALSGEIALRVALIQPFLYRVLYDADSSLLGTLRRKEGTAPCPSVPDVDRAYDCLGSVYEFYRMYHGRDSIDGAGMLLTAFVRVCFLDKPCPWRNAAWVGDDYNYFIFGADYCVDDVVAHEFTHGVTEFTSGLLYLNESGAINESFSDMWGEWVDQSNAIGNDSENVKWLIGEDLPGGAGRNMKNPAAYPYNDADRKGSENWRRLPAGIMPMLDNDYGYVHTNCGVNNKLCYLLTDGAEFNGYQIAGMGIARVAALYYEVQTGDLLPAAADYDDLYFALTHAARNLNWTWTDRQNLENACRAVGIAVTSWTDGASVEIDAEQ